VGSGKTFASVIEAMRQPRGSVGMMVAPTYPMLRDATLRTFLDLARRGNILRDYNRQDKEAKLAGGRTVLFRTGQFPDRLRGPNLGWFAVDEGALCAPGIWPILIGRLRLKPGKGWVATTPRGKLNWTHRTFTDGGADYDTIVASTRDAFWHDPAFVGSMLANYSEDFARQEIDGAILDDAQEALLPEWWLDGMELVIRSGSHPAGRRRMGVDLGYGTGRDSFTYLVRDNLSILSAFECPYVGVPQAAQLVAEKSREWDVEQGDITYDGAGPGRDMARYLENYRITDAVAYFGGAKQKRTATNKRSLVAWRMRQRLDPQRPMPFEGDPDPSKCHPLFAPPPKPAIVRTQAPFSLPVDRPWWPRLKEELGELKYSMRDRKVELEKKEDLVARLKRSPNLADALLMTFNDGDD
jgi:hypothetical protein